MFIIRLAIYTCHPSNGRFVGCSRLHESLSYLSSSGLIQLPPTSISKVFGYIAMLFTLCRHIAE